MRSRDAVPVVLLCLVGCTPTEGDSSSSSSTSSSSTGGPSTTSGATSRAGSSSATASSRATASSGGASSRGPSSLATSQFQASSTPGASSAGTSAGASSHATSSPQATSQPQQGSSATSVASSAVPGSSSQGSTAVCTGSGCLQPGSCPGGGPAARFVDQLAPPSGVAAGAVVDVWVAFVNCGSSTWQQAVAGAPNGHKLGSRAPQDNTTWGNSRFALPASVPPQTQVTIPFQVTAPALSGSYPFSFAIVEEGVAWLAEDSTVVNVNVGGGGGTVELCPGVMVDASGARGETAAVQQCVDATAAGGTLVFPPGEYLMDGQLVLSRPITLQTAGTAGVNQTCLRGLACAVLRAAPGFNQPNGVVHVTSPMGVVLDHMVVDGNRGNRLGGAAAAQCAGGANIYGFNAQADDCGGCAFLYSATVNALCGSGFVWVGDQAVIRGSYVAHNGDHVTTNMWADGITLLRSANAVVEDNVFEDNSDVDLILGGSTQAMVQRNQVTHVSQASFAGLMLDNFNGSTPGDFTGTLVTGNQVQCGNHQCDFGIELGPTPWYASANIVGGTVTANTVTGAKQGINVAGAGTVGSPLVLYNNTVSGAGASATFLCGTHATSNLNIAPGSVVDRMGDVSPATSFPWADCP